MENLAGVAVAALLAATAGAAQAAPFRIVSDGPDSVWVLDTASGELDWCRLKAVSGPKVLDVFGESAQPREATPRRGLPACEPVLAGDQSDPRYARAAALFGYGGGLFYGSSGTYGDLYGAGTGTYGDLYNARTGTYADLYGVGGSQQINIVGPGYFDIDID
jgi:hypothetical protein